MELPHHQHVCFRVPATSDHAVSHMRPPSYAGKPNCCTKLSFVLLKEVKVLAQDTRLGSHHRRRSTHHRAMYRESSLYDRVSFTPRSNTSGKAHDFNGVDVLHRSGPAQQEYNLHVRAPRESRSHRSLLRALSCRCVRWLVHERTGSVHPAQTA